MIKRLLLCLVGAAAIGAQGANTINVGDADYQVCILYTSPSPRD